MQLVEMAHVIVSRRLQEVGALGDLKTTYSRPRDRDHMIFANVRRRLDEAWGDCEAVVQAFRSHSGTRPPPGHLGFLLDELPTAADAVNAYLSWRANPASAACAFAR